MIRPAILWNDGRTGEETEYLNTVIGKDKLSQYTAWGNYPHHGAVMFGHYGKAFYEVVKFLGLDVKKIGYNQPAGVRYPTENPWG